MANIMFFNIPAHGHTNPTIEVVRALCARGHRVRYYSFSEFREKLEEAGAEVMLCDEALPPAPEDLPLRVGRDFALLMDLVVSVTENLHDGIAAEMETFKPDCIVSDSVCIWGKLFARRFGVPLVCSTTTMAFNQYTAKRMKQRLVDMLRMIAGMPRVMKRLSSLEALGYETKGIIELLQNDNDTDTIVYTSRLFQPMAETFSERYAFVGPSIRMPARKAGERKRPLVYVSLGTVLNRNAGFYRKCIAALRGLDCDAVISVGLSTDIDTLGEVPENIRVFPRVNQLQVLAQADVFVTHCGMNSAMESLYCGVPMVLFPQHAEERAVADRVRELGAGAYLKRATERGIQETIMTVIDTAKYKEGAWKMAKDFAACAGAQGAADFIEKACGKGI